MFLFANLRLYFIGPQSVLLVNFPPHWISRPELWAGGLTIPLVVVRKFLRQFWQALAGCERWLWLFFSFSLHHPIRDDPLCICKSQHIRERAHHHHSLWRIQSPHGISICIHSFAFLPGGHTSAIFSSSVQNSSFICSQQSVCGAYEEKKWGRWFAMTMTTFMRPSSKWCASVIMSQKRWHTTMSTPFLVLGLPSYSTWSRDRCLLTYPRTPEWNGTLNQRFDLMLWAGQLSFTYSIVILVSKWFAVRGWLLEWHNNWESLGIRFNNGFFWSIKEKQF